MALLEPITRAPVVEVDEGGARRALRAQIARLEHELASAVAHTRPRVKMEPVRGHAGPRLLGLTELELLRDDLAGRIADVRAAQAATAERAAAKRLLVEDMLLAPERFKWVRVTNEELGETGCKSWHVRPRLGLIGMLAGWWHVKISSGCPLATSHGTA
jgi:hypothetical protein